MRLTLIIHGFPQNAQKLVKTTCIGGLEWWERKGKDRRGRRAKASGYLRLLFPKEAEHLSSHSPSPAIPSAGMFLLACNCTQ